MGEPLTSGLLSSHLFSLGICAKSNLPLILTFSHKGRRDQKGFAHQQGGSRPPIRARCMAMLVPLNAATDDDGVGGFGVHGHAPGSWWRSFSGFGLPNLGISTESSVPLILTFSHKGDLCISARLSPRSAPVTLTSILSHRGRGSLEVGA